MKTSHTWKKTILSPEATVKDAIESLSNSSMKIVLLLSEENHLFGTITDGDIRRGMLRDIKLEDKASLIMNSDPLVVSEEMSADFVLKLMQSNSFNAIPIVDRLKKVTGIHLIGEMISTKEITNKMIVMAGGRGERLMPKTENCPKPLLPINGKPMLEHIVLRAKDQGFYNFIFSVNYLGQMIKDYFSDGSKWGVNVEYIEEDSPLGTAGSLYKIKGLIDEPIVVTNADVVTDINYERLLAYHNEHNDSVATMTVRLHEFQHPFGVVNTNGINIMSLEEKPKIQLNVNAGVYVLNPETLDYLADNKFCDMPSLFTVLSEKKLRTIVYPIHETWHDIGHLEEYLNANKEN